MHSESREVMAVLHTARPREYVEPPRTAAGGSRSSVNDDYRSAAYRPMPLARRGLDGHELNDHPCCGARFGWVRTTMAVIIDGAADLVRGIRAMQRPANPPASDVPCRRVATVATPPK